MRRLLICAALLLGSDLSAQQPKPLAAADVAAVEHAFAAMARDSGTKAAFLEYLAPDGVVFRPGPVNGRESTAALPASRALLAWRPAVADMAASGELGYTTGPYRVHPTPDAAPTSSGYFVTLWRRQPNGALRAELDFGLRTTLPSDSAEPLKLWPAEKSAAPLSPMDVPGLDAQLAQGADSLVHERVRTYATSAFHHGSAARAALFAKARPQTQRVAGGVAASNDLGYSYGEYRWNEESGWYLHIWRVVGARPRLVLEVYSPTPPK